MPDVFSMDVETHSAVDLTSQGADVYSRDASTRALMAAYHLAGSPSPGRLWLEGDPVPPEWLWHVNNGGYFSGWNVLFFDRLIYARIFVEKWGFPSVHDDAWIDSMHRASLANLPRSLDACGKAVGLQFDADKKDSNRIRRVTSAKRTPIPATVSDILNGRAPEAAQQKTVGKVTLLEDLQWLAARCRQDILMEEELLSRLPAWPEAMPWVNIPRVDRDINDRGILLDVELVKGLRTAAKQKISEMNADMVRLTNGQVTAVTEVEAIKRWLVGVGVELPSNLIMRNPDDPEPDEDEEKELAAANARRSPWQLRKSDMADLLARTDLPEAARLVIAARAEANKVSVSKFNRMLANVSPDGRLRNTMTVGGAQQTMRWASRGCNLYNTVRDVFGNPDEIADKYKLNAKQDHDRVKQLQDDELHQAILTGRLGDPAEIDARYTRTRKDPQGREQTLGVLTWISRMTRRTLAAPQDHLLINGDFAQVEARVTDWLAQEISMLQAYATGQDVYKILASSIYKISQDALTKEQRQAGKVGKLACGFGGGINALLTMAYGYGLLLSTDEASTVVKGYRAANQAQVRYWFATDDAAANAVMYPGREFPVGPLGLVSYFKEGDCLHCRLPSRSRTLRYWQPRLVQETWADGKKKDRLSLYGLAIKGKAIFSRALYHTILVENQVQAIAADMLAIALGNMDEARLPVVLHVYDSIAGEVAAQKAQERMSVFKQAMEFQPSWTYGLPTKADVEIGARFG